MAGDCGELEIGDKSTRCQEQKKPVDGYRACLSML
jgi:hypothetical protein